MAHPKARWEKGTPETQARMAAISQKAKEAREARRATVEPSLASGDRKPFAVSAFPVMTVDVNEFTGVSRGFPQTSFGPNFLPDQPPKSSWPGDKRG
jgi:hypothetical protein